MRMNDTRGNNVLTGTSRVNETEFQDFIEVIVWTFALLFFQRHIIVTGWNDIVFRKRRRVMVEDNGKGQDGRGVLDRRGYTRNP